MTTPRHYYNEIDPFAAQWLRNLMAAGLIPRGDIDTRSIEDVIPNELREYTQCHFFAGLGGWPYALQLAGWGERPVWTGSCPCQPFSAAGKGAGFDDERHLWPAWQHLIEQCRPAIVFGEQVASKDADAWIDLVHADLEGMGYAFGCVPFPAAGVGAPHIRDRNYWVAYSDDPRLERWIAVRERPPECIAGARGLAGRLADAADQRLDGRRTSEASDGRHAARIEPQRLCHVGRLADADRAGSQSRQWNDEATRYGHPASAARSDDRQESTGPTNGFWRAADWLRCTDGKWRPVEPGTFPLAHGAASRVGRLRAYGNAIVPPAVAEFVKAYMACCP